MADKHQCLLCGKTTNIENSLCEDCQHITDNHYKTNFVERDNGVNTDKDADKNVLAGDGVNASAKENMNQNENGKKKPKSSRKGIIFLLIGSLLIIIVGIISCLFIIENRKQAEHEETYWNTCIVENTPLSYAKYLVRFPEGSYAEEAERRIQQFKEEEINDWLKVKLSGDIYKFYSFLDKYPKTIYMPEARSLMDSLSWLAATHDNTLFSYKAYLENVDLGNIPGSYGDSARIRYKYLSGIKTLEDAPLDSLKNNIRSVLSILSQNKEKDVADIFAPKTSYFGTEINNTDLADSIARLYKAKDIKSITYRADSSYILAKRDNKGIVFVDLVIRKETTYNEMLKKDKKTKKTEHRKGISADTLSVELDPHSKIRSVKSK